MREQIVPPSWLEKEYAFDWHWELKAPPEAIWPFVADTNRFNRDTDLPPVVSSPETGADLTHPMTLTHMGIRVDWQEEPFEWAAPQYFSIVRRYTRGPVKKMRGYITLERGPDGGTRIRYRAWLTPANLLGHLAIPVQVGLIAKNKTERILKHYDRLAMLEAGASPETGIPARRFAPGGRETLARIAGDLKRETDSPWLERLLKIVTDGDDFTVRRLRPYPLADTWGASRREILELCLEATRAGMLTLGWNLLCPLCRGTQAPRRELKEVSASTHCPSCNIDFTVDFDRSVEVTFSPHPAIRDIPPMEFCTGAPQRTPHIRVQQIAEPGQTKSVAVSLAPGLYRIRGRGDQAGLVLTVQETDGSDALRLACAETWQSQGNNQPVVNRDFTLHLRNDATERRLLVLEDLRWDENAATAAEVTALQKFRDLFASEALRPDEQISVGNLTVVFTDLKDSTALYREIGDAPAFGSVMSHFDLLRDAIVAEEGAVVKTMGDAVMAVFTRPAQAVRAMLKAQRMLSATAINGQFFRLKIGIHQGPCIAVNLNERLDYFGSTVNIAARLQGLSVGDDMVISPEIYQNPDVASLLAEAGNDLHTEVLHRSLKGFGEQQFELIRLAQPNAHPAERRLQQQAPRIEPTGNFPH